MLYCGMDLHAKESFVHVIDRKGNRVLVRRLARISGASWVRDGAFAAWTSEVLDRASIL